LKEIRRQHPTTAAIMMTAQAEPDLAAEAARLGAYRLIDKPFDIYELETLVREASHSHTVSHVA
jgi:two-component system response regulator AtoC